MKDGRKMVSIIIMVLAITLMLGFAQVNIKKGLNSIGKLEIKEFFSSKLLSVISNSSIQIGIVMYAAATWLWLVALSKSELSFVYPLVALSYVFGALFAKIYFSEAITWIRWIGIFVIILGALLITKS